MITHQEAEQLASDYLEGLLSLGERGRVDLHLANCAQCQEVFADVSQVLGKCQIAERAEPSPWLVAKILQSTVGNRQASWIEQLAMYFRPLLAPRVAYPIAMSIFAFSFITSAAGFNLRQLRWDDLNPGTWTRRADRQGHLMMARAEKYYYDLRVVYEIETRFRKLNNSKQIEPTPEPAAPEGGTSQDAPVDRTTASNSFFQQDLASPQASIAPGPPALVAFQDLRGDVQP